MSENEFESYRDTDEEYEVIDGESLAGKILSIGRRGENGTQTLRIDASALAESLPGCELQIAVVRPNEQEVYLPTVTVADGVISWPILRSDLTEFGLGYGEVRAVKGDQVKKSAVFRTRIEFGLPGPDGE